MTDDVKDDAPKDDAPKAKGKTPKADVQETEFVENPRYGVKVEG